MALQATIRQKALLVAKHEFGHWLMAARLGFVPGDIEIAITHHGQGHRGGASVTLDEEMKSVESIQYYARRRIVVLFAGSFAESLTLNGKVDPRYAIDQLEGRDGGAKDDFSKVRELLRVLRGTQYPTPQSNEEHNKQLAAIQQPLWDGSGEIIEQDHEVILGMSQAIASRLRALDAPFGMKEGEIRELPATKEWLERVAEDQMWLRFK